MSIITETTRCSFEYERIESSSRKTHFRIHPNIKKPNNKYKDILDQSNKTIIQSSLTRIDVNLLMIKNVHLFPKEERNQRIDTYIENIRKAVEVSLDKIEEF